MAAKQTEVQVIVTLRLDSESFSINKFDAIGTIQNVLEGEVEDYQLISAELRRDGKKIVEVR